MLTRLKHKPLARSNELGWQGVLLNPFYLARRALWFAVQDLASGLGGNLLDVGCGTMPYRSLFGVSRYVSLDIDSERTRALSMADHYYDGDRFPFDDGSFDSLLCNQVLEHVFTPDHFVQEMHRVLKPGGRLLLTVPFVWDEHEQPWDYARYSSFGLRALLESHGFKVVEQRKLLADASIFFQLWNAYIFKVVRSRGSFSRILATFLVYAPATVAGLLVVRMLPHNPDFFLDQIVLAERQ
jgi:SAM-dependent methyltransferase